MSSWWDDITGFVNDQKDRKRVEDLLWNASTLDEFDGIWNGLNETQKKYYMAERAYQVRHPILEKHPNGADDLVSGIFQEALDAWLKTIESYDMKDPAKAKENLVKLTGDVMKVAAGTAAIDFTMGLWPNGEGTISSMNTKQLLAWLGVGAVVTAVAHDPVKIGMLRPYQDLLEATFRNRRPGDIALFQAYKTRELSPAKVEDLSKLTDQRMDEIEKENDDYYFREIAKWGYSELFATALSRSATVTLNFSQLTALARQGLLTRGLAIYSLWGQGLDRVVMKPALDALMKQNEMASYEGFRSMIEPSYVEGDISEDDLGAYWDRIAVPKDVQAWVIPRMRKKREAYLLKQKTGAAVKERDLTVSQIQQAFQNLLTDRAHAQNMILSMGYSLDEVKILLDLAELRRKLPGAATLKRLPLSDYEKAHKNGLISQEKVLDRMQGEYAPEDIALEKALLEKGKA